MTSGISGRVRPMPNTASTTTSAPAMSVASGACTGPAQAGARPRGGAGPRAAAEHVDHPDVEPASRSTRPAT